MLIRPEGARIFQGGGGSRRPSQTYEDLALLKIYMITDE